ncbi:MAG: NAD(P)H-binding protein [Chloroflexi bacterium]|nr:NAD(P)H-binding protein [Chloroflexota bacterium]
MQIAILGAGNIGGTIGEKWAQAGHTVKFGVRDPQKPELQSLVKSLGANTSAASIADAIKSAEVVLFAIPGRIMADTIAANAQALDGKILIDATNNMGADSVNSFPAFKQHTPNASLYRTFNCYGWENFKNPIPGADLFYAGTDGAAKKTIEQLISDVGLHPVYVGGVDQAGLLDGVLGLWFALAGGQKMGRKLAFKVLTGE